MCSQNFYHWIQEVRKYVERTQSSNIINVTHLIKRHAVPELPMGSDHSCLRLEIQKDMDNNNTSMFFRIIFYCFI